MRTNIFILISVALVYATSPCLALTPKEKVVARHAKSELVQAQKERDAAKAETQNALLSVADSQNSAMLAGQKALEAEAQVKAEHDQLVKAVTQNSKMRKVYDACTKWWGIGAILYGIGSLMKHLLILAVILIVVGVLLTIFVPAARPIFSMITSFFSMLWARLMSLFTPKPKTP